VPTCIPLPLILHNLAEVQSLLVLWLLLLLLLLFVLDTGSLVGAVFEHSRYLDERVRRAAIRLHNHCFRRLCLLLQLAQSFGRAWVRIFLNITGRVGQRGS